MKIVSGALRVSTTFITHRIQDRRAPRSAVLEYTNGSRSQECHSLCRQVVCLRAAISFAGCSAKVRASRSERGNGEV